MLRYQIAILLLFAGTAAAEAPTRGACMVTCREQLDACFDGEPVCKKKAAACKADCDVREKRGDFCMSSCEVTDKFCRNDGYSTSAVCDEENLDCLERCLKKGG